MVVLTCGWMVSSRGLGRTCSGVLSPCGGFRVGIFCRFPVFGLLVRGYAPWCRVSYYHTHLVLNIVYL